MKNTEKLILFYHIVPGLSTGKTEIKEKLVC